MKRDKRSHIKNVATSVLLPVALQKAVVKKAKQEERSFSAVIRCALKKELKFEESHQSKKSG
ncbi:MAG: ribbon-helix-helix protein, CopG family [Verrucomicrobiota bacterium]|jgi:predicted transcriptional regulator